MTSEKQHGRAYPVSIHPSFVVTRGVKDIEEVVHRLHLQQPVRSHEEQGGSTSVFSTEPTLYMDASSQGSAVAPSGSMGQRMQETQSHITLNSINIPMSNSPSAAAHPRLLCVWDVDDTLVASGNGGLRQNLVFPESEMLALFKSCPPNTRHLLLSQGSIDDVFEKESGRLNFLRRFFARDRHHHSSTSPGCFPFGGVLGCSNAEVREGQVADPCQLEKGTVIVRLSNIRCGPETQEEAHMLHHRVDPSAAMDALEQEDGQVRWLILRPKMWGISLASLNNLVLPSSQTASLSGRELRKMDIVWSLASTGHWDAVLFVDNNLSEVGVVRFGMNMVDLLELKSSRRMDRFFQGEYLLLAAAAYLRKMELRTQRHLCAPSARSSVDGVAWSSIAQERSATRQQDQASNDVMPFATIYPSDSLNSQTSTPPEQAKLAFSAMSASPEPTTTTSNFLSDTLQGASNPLHLPECQERHVRLVVANLHIPASTYKRVLLRHDSQLQSRPRGSTFSVERYSGHPLFMGDSSCTDDQFNAIIKLFRHEEHLMVEWMEEDLRVNGLVHLSRSRRWSPRIHQVLIAPPAEPRPHVIPHMCEFYRTHCAAIMEKLVQPLKSSTKLNEMERYSLRMEAQSLYADLLRKCPIVDPAATADLAWELFHVYISQGEFSKSTSKRLMKSVDHLLRGGE